VAVEFVESGKGLGVPKLMELGLFVNIVLGIVDFHLKYTPN
jgi:hypothetical protein